MKRQLSNAVNCRHGRIILLSRGGVCNREIAQRVGCTARWVRTVIHRFNAGGIDAITWYPYYCHRGGPVKFVADITEQIAERGGPLATQGTDRHERLVAAQAA